MRSATFDKARVVKYLAWTFGLAYAVQVGAAFLYNHGSRQAGQLVIAAMMFVPALGVLLSGAGLKGMGWKPGIRKNIRCILIAWFAPIILTAVGAGLYFLAFPGHFDLSGSYMVANGGAEVLEQMRAQGISYPLYALIGAISCVTYAPLINMVTALGEEIGWRGVFVSAAESKTRPAEGLAAGRRDLGRVALAAHLADRL